MAKVKSKVRVLDEATINRIAAGEVVESQHATWGSAPRPALDRSKLRSRGRGPLDAPIR